jgi:predicted nucleic acid-binding protein
VRKVFADTSALVALFYEKDENHGRAEALLRKVMETKTFLVITDYVLDECVTGILSNAGHEAAVRAGEYLLNSRIIEQVWLDQPAKLRAWEYFKKHDDKRYSFTDCTSFVLMREMKITKYLSFDGHFKQAGFDEFR